MWFHQSYKRFDLFENLIMEDVARLAVVEYTIRDFESFNKLLHELLQKINQILQNPDDLEARTLNSAFLKRVMKHGVFCEYLKYIGFKPVNNEYIFPKDQSLIKLRYAQETLQRKISICYGSKNPSETTSVVKKSKPNLKPVSLETNIPLFNRIRMVFNHVLVYEEEEVQEMAREVIPIIDLEMKAVERVREHQKKLKLGEVQGNDVSYELALIIELVGWFKHEFFTWMDKPECPHCGGSTTLTTIVKKKLERETCNVEVFNCEVCKRETLFPRYNDVRNLLRTRQGRCGEWANCFALLCRTLGYDTRYVFDTNDHVWCEVFDYVADSWVHIDPCEGLLDAPLVYSCGWGTKLAYVIAVSRDDVQDVTWRYTVEHEEVRKRRTVCYESDLVWFLMEMRRLRQADVSESRRQYLAKRGVKELVQLMVEKKPGDYEKHGRMSGALEWREGRGETDGKSYSFKFSRPGNYGVDYATAADKYYVSRGWETEYDIRKFAAGTYTCDNVFRKVERDWKKVYLARRGGAESGVVSWKFEAKDESLALEEFVVEVNATTFENGRVRCTVQLDDESPKEINTKRPAHFKRQFKEAVITCHLSGGVGDRSWQHAQLFRQSLNSDDCLLKISVNVVKKSDKAE